MVFGFRPLGSRFYDPAPTYDPAVPYILRSLARPRPSAASADDQEPRELIAKADNYDVAYAQLRAQLPEGWVLLGIDRYLENEQQ